MVEVLIKCSCCSIPGTWFDGVVLVFAGKLEYVIVIYWSFWYGKFLTNPGISARICTDSHRNFSKPELRDIFYLLEHFLINYFQFQNLFIYD